MKTRLLPVIFCVTTAVACSSSSKGDGATTKDVVTTDPDPDAGSTSDPASSSSGGPAPGADLKMSATTFRNVGRLGTTIRIQMSGSDPRSQTSAAHVRFTDENDAPAPTLDSDWDGLPDAAEGTFHFDTSTLGKVAFDGTITIPKAFGPKTKAKNVYIALENESGARAPLEVKAVLEAQLEKSVTEPCDPEKIESRCAPGLSCGGTPAVCQPGGAPVLSKVAYFGGAAPRMVFRGDEPDEDLDSIAVEFLDNANALKMVTLSGEGPDAITANRIDVDARASGFGPIFFVQTEPIPGFVSQVPKIAATASDAIGRASERVIVPLSSPAIRSAGQSCDPDGFDACVSSAVCSPGIRSATNTCKSATSARTEKCKATPSLDPSKGLTRAYGVVAGVSLWDAPVGCVSNDATGRPEAAIPLKLNEAAPSLTITTALPDTSFDTAVYLVAGCAASASNALGCNDDVKGFSSTLTLKNVPAGDYTIVVESVQMRGGRFGVAVSLE